MRMHHHYLLGVLSLCSALSNVWVVILKLPLWLAAHRWRAVKPPHLLLLLLLVVVLKHSTLSLSLSHLNLPFPLTLALPLAHLTFAFPFTLAHDVRVLLLNIRMLLLEHVLLLLLCWVSQMRLCERVTMMRQALRRIMLI